MNSGFVDNFKFTQLLEESTLSFQEKYDIKNIFNCLTDNRKVIIIDNWPFYLDKILQLSNISYEKRRENIFTTLNNLNKIIHESMLRQKDLETKAIQINNEKMQIDKNVLVYNSMKKSNELMKIISSIK